MRTKKAVSKSKKKQLPDRPKMQTLPTKVSTMHRGDHYLLSFFRFVIAVLKYAVVLLIGGLLALFCTLLIVGSLYIGRVSAFANKSPGEIMSLLIASKSHAIHQEGNRKNILILGTDALENRDESSSLTDSIMVASISLQTGVITTFSFPRDLYIASQTAKINSLYEKGKTISPGKPEEPLVQTVEDISHIHIQNVLSMDIATVGRIIDAFGGLDVEIENSFVDYKFPRTDVDVRVERDPAKLYEVIAFSKGKEHMSGDRALRFMRSRHSLDPVEGSDDGRVKRQQRVIAALLEKLKDPLLLRNPEQIGKLMKIYSDSFEKSLPLAEVGAIAYHMGMAHQLPQFVSYQFSTQGSDAILFHPERHVSGAWVYLPVDPNYSQMRDKVSEWLK